MCACVCMCVRCCGCLGECVWFLVMYDWYVLVGGVVCVVWVCCFVCVGVGVWVVFFFFWLWGAL